MIKSRLSFALAAMLAPAPTVQNFIIDPNPTRWQPGITSLFKEVKSFLKSEKNGSLEKVVDYFTSTTNPSVANANNGGVGGVYLYVNDGSLTGTWTRHQIGYGDCYEHAAAFKYPGDKYPGIIASCDNRLVWFENPAWQRHVIVSHVSRMINLAAWDVDGDGIPEIALASEFSNDPAQSPGVLSILKHNGDPKEPWTSMPNTGKW